MLKKGYRHDNHCVDCNATINDAATRCVPCSQLQKVGKPSAPRNPRPKGRRLDRKCVDCGASIADQSTRCGHCFGVYNMNQAHIKTALRLQKLGSKRPNMTGDKHPRFAGEKIDHSGGYIEVYAPNRPSTRRSGRMLEHRLVMEEHIGRPLRRQEVVHHKNKIRSDNRIENLMLFPNVRAHTAWEYIEECEERLVKVQGYQRSPHFWETLQLLLSCSSE